MTTIRRLTPLRPSRGTLIPPDLRFDVYRRDRGCVGRRVGMPGDCVGLYELDHVRASGALGRKSETSIDNLVSLCAYHHRLKTMEGRRWRPRLIAYLETAR